MSDLTRRNYLFREITEIIYREEKLRAKLDHFTECEYFEPIWHPVVSILLA